jgi:mono/diheme cytochrome c family protein
MLKNILGALVFTVAVFFVVDFIGNVMVNPATAPHQSNLKIAEAEPAPAPEPPQEAASSTPTSTPEAASPEAASPEAVTPEAVTPEAVTPEVAAPVVAPATAPVIAQATAMAGDVDTGSKTFRKKCMGCHTAD